MAKKKQNVKDCIICGKPIFGQRSDAFVHVGECKKEYDRRREKEKYLRRKAREMEDPGAGPEWKKERPCCECGTPFTPAAPKQVTCCDPACQYARKKKLEQLRKQGIFQQDNATNHFGEYQMPCPFDKMDYLAPGCVSWYQAEMVPVI